MTTNKGLSSDIRTYISLFSSAGMGCYGIKLEGYECIATCELLERRIKMQSYNNKCRYKSGYISGDITQQETQDRILEQYAYWKKHHQIKDIDVVIATPPSQGMSIANHKKCVSYQTETRTAAFLNGTVNPDAFMRTPMDETTGLDEDELVNAKMDQNEAKYPVEKAKGSAAKYTSYEERDVTTVLMRMPGHLRGLLKETQEYLLSLGEEVEQNNARRYYSYKAKRVFAAVIPDRTRVIINLRIDPKTVAIDDYFARDLHGVHSYGPASLQLQLFVRNEEQLEDAKKYMKQAYEENR